MLEMFTLRCLFKWRYLSGGWIYEYGVQGRGSGCRYKFESHQYRHGVDGIYIHETG